MRSPSPLNPRFAAAIHNLEALDRDDEAVAHYQKATEPKGDFAEAHGTLGAALSGRRSIAIEPRSGPDRHNPGAIEDFTAVAKMR